MTLRVFTDEDGSDWHVWNVDPSSARTGVRSDLRDGWLCFERASGGDRSRLALSDVPPGWEQLPASALDRLRRSASVNRPYRSLTTRESTAPSDDRDEEAARRRTSGPKRALGGEDDG